MTPGNPSAPFPPFPTPPLRYSETSPDARTGEEDFLASVQGNILKGHGREHQRFVFFRFNSPEAGRAFLREAAAEGGQLGENRWVCSALNQRVQRGAWHRAWQAEQLLANPGRQLEANRPYFHYDDAMLRSLVRIAETQLFSSLMLSLAGLKFLGLEPPASEEFAGGMKARMTSMLEPGEMSAAPYHSAAGFHGMFLLACDSRPRLAAYADTLSTWCRKHKVTLLQEFEEGFAWRKKRSPYGNGYRPPREPFGFADGISQPQFFTDQRTEPPMRGAAYPPAWKWVDLRLDQVFLTEPGHVGGSLVALLKIEQKVATFRAHEARVARLLRRKFRLPPRVARYVAPAVMMGRTREGYPLHEVLDRLQPAEAGLRALFPAGPAAPDPRDPCARPPAPPAWLNEFDFEPRPMGPQAPVRGCPFHMHARKMNPRTAASVHGHADTFVAAQPVRRGATYDPLGLLPRAERNGGRPWPDGKVGLLFLAYMSDLQRQFEQTHTHWSRDPTFVEAGGVDPVLAQPDPAQTPVAQTFGGSRLPKMPKVLKRLGGSYLYAPSIPWLRNAGR